MADVASPQGSAKCVHCGAWVLSPEWTENTSADAAVHIWHCLVCGHEFETTDHDVEKTPAEDELVQEFLPDLLVE